ncbi:hypothetical protein EC844_12927 [Acinetobacter calcoaceticus]|uniref:Uncharacterized protein n=1 Tax=Acinetobacter calcoaceticus TaxID=471 RepID=A0A4R1XC15_ACICA|nr:hypothetical protein EC844_12927 [Acinetobacter calcoaceticus]
MKLLKLALLSAVSLAGTVHAADLEIGDSKSSLGSLKLSGFLRAKFQDKDYSDADHSLKFDAAKINLDYKSQYLFGHVEYRCYQFDKLCDFSSLVDAYMGYNINPQSSIKLGLQDIPFGPYKFWSSNYYGGVNSQVGLEDVHNLGINYNIQPIKGTTLDLAYFARDGGKYHGSNGEASRYSSNYVSSNDPDQTCLKEKNMWIGRINQELNFLDNEHLKTSVGASYWYSTIDNKRTNQDGSRKAWAVFSQVAYDELKFTFTGGKNDVDNGDYTQSAQSSVGSFDDLYMVANQGTFYTADLSYTFKDVYKGISIMPYMMYSSYQKSQSGFKDSSRNIIGATIDYKSFSLVSEYIIGKHDPSIGGTADSLGAGDDGRRNKMLNLTMLYHF